jgi:hypothetical protein
LAPQRAFHAALRDPQDPLLCERRDPRDRDAQKIAVVIADRAENLSVSAAFR